MRSIDKRLTALEQRAQATTAPQTSAIDTSWWTPALAGKVADILREIGALDEVLAWQQKHYSGV